MNPWDVGNGLFEAGGAYFTWMNAWKLHKDQEVKGVYWPITGFFAVWGIWNLFYYHALGQTLSWLAGMALVLGNIIWVAQAIRLSLKKKRQKERARVVKRIRGEGWVMADGPECDLPPIGWRCTRGSGHEGPCAAWPVER